MVFNDFKYAYSYSTHEFTKKCNSMCKCNFYDFYMSLKSYFDSYEP